MDQLKMPSLVNAFNKPDQLPETLQTLGCNVESVCVLAPANSEQRDLLSMMLTFALLQAANNPEHETTAEDMVCKYIGTMIEPRPFLDLMIEEAVKRYGCSNDFVRTQVANFADWQSGLNLIDAETCSAIKNVINGTATELPAKVAERYVFVVARGCNIKLSDPVIYQFMQASLRQPVDPLRHVREYVTQTLKTAAKKVGRARAAAIITEASSMLVGTRPINSKDIVGTNDAETVDRLAAILTEETLTLVGTRPANSKDIVGANDAEAVVRLAAILLGPAEAMRIIDTQQTADA